MNALLLRPALRTVPQCMSRVGLVASHLFADSSPLLRRLSFSTHASRTTASAIPRRQHPLFLTTLTASAIALPYLLNPSVTSHDSSPSPDISSSAYRHSRDANVPLSKDSGKSLNPAAIRQISMGSLMGLGLGVVVSAFSRMLVLLLGVGIVITQYAARQGYNILPVDKMQRYVRGINLRSALNDNAAFKISFGLMFALTALGEF